MHTKEGQEKGKEHEDISKSHGRADDRRDYGRDLICWTSISVDRDMYWIRSNKTDRKERV